ncbi:MAG: membrane protein insertase YidC, partial [Alistipes sp.]|nr:membrane protein insertase YidC [Alistipes sp.]
MDKKTIIGIVLMSLIFIGYVLFNSKQQAEYQEYLQTVQVEEPVAQEATAVEAEAQIADSLTLATAEQREVNMFGESLVAARNGEVKQIEMKNDYLTIDFTTRGGAMQRVVLEEYTKYAPKDERTEKVTLFDPESAMFDMEFYVKKGLNNVKVNTSEYVFQTEGVRRQGDRQVLTMQLEVAPGAYLQYEYILYDEKNPSRDYLVDFNVKLQNLAPVMAQQSTLGLAWSDRTYQNERSYKTENMYTTISYRLPDEDGVEDLGMGEARDEKVQSDVNWVAFRQQFFSQAFIAYDNFAYADMGFTAEADGSGFVKSFSSRMGVEYTPQTTEYNFGLYCGPNKYAVLTDVVAPDGETLSMERLIPLDGWLVGWFNRWIVIPVFDFLRNYIASFGIIILILTILVKL